ncbi:acetyltransferase (GNAT) family protein [Rhodobacter sp. JA431]|uniref:GNAT family N-acetyltransferase n=1 Tax=Rhodobacter sp. JA431 TaxID=570013 RepID=UPI000BD3986F|nr:GNAT family N-acetyltransferase [Rhodobacter sp. JA431]SOC20428.1 acetyltransferase (GNAT) family protein [Rhodobacter sp. JA431]
MEQITLRKFSVAAPVWEAGVEALAPAAALQNRFGYGEIAAGGGRGLRRYEIMLGAQRIGLAQLVGRAGLWLAARGPVLAPDLAPDLQRAALRRLARAVPGVFIATPEVPVSGFGLVPLITSRHQAHWDLDPAQAELRAGMQGKWRNRLVAAEKAKLRLCEETETDWLIKAEARQRDDRGYRALPPGFVAAWGMAVPDGVLTLSVRDAQGQRLAGVMALVSGALASYHLGWSGAEGRALGAHNLLLWHLALRLKARGVRLLDLGDVNSEAGAGLMHFKMGTGAKLHRLGATCLVLPG